MIPIHTAVPHYFFEEEIRCGFTVSQERKEMWAIELDLFEEFVRVCKKYNLKYCAGAGTLLGAVRHGGFIPWDDDLDLYMLRNDYDILMKHADDFREPYFLQTSLTEKNLLRTHAQLRNGNTTGFIKEDYYKDINKGIFIDIFPLDGVQDDAPTAGKQLKKDRFYRSLIRKYPKNYPYDNETQWEWLIKTFIKKIIFVLYRKEKLYSDYEGNLKQFSIEGTRFWGNRTLVFACPKSRRPIEDWKDLIEADFEYTKIAIPRNYDEILKQQYGNYMRIPENKNGNVHGALTVSVNESYRTFAGAHPCR